jgi:acetyltransferase-like isoleucine patch superfamily enzyme
MSVYERFDYMPWLLPYEPEEIRRAVAVISERRQLGAQAHNAITFGRGVFLAESARLFAAPGSRRIFVGDHTYVAAGARIYNNVSIGCNCSINTNCMLDGGEAGIFIGDDTRIACDASIFAFEHVFSDPSTPFRTQGVVSRGVRIGRDVGIANKAIVRDGITIGDGAFVAAGAVVTRDVSALAVVAGNPARVIGIRGRKAEA